MSAATFNLTTTPVQVSDGLKSVYIQEVRGRLTRFTCTATQPDPETITYCTILNNDVSVAEGFPLWAWSEGQPIEIAVLRAE